jgi:hypothetical protein
MSESQKEKENWHMRSNTSVIENSDRTGKLDSRK